ncbi:hypothetical protein ACQEU3_14815 [Spirillospora sp. CA-253888]
MQEPSGERSDAAQVTEEQVAVLRAELRRVREARLAAEKRTQGRTTAESAVRSAAQDRDVVTSPELQAVQARSDELAERLQAMWLGNDWIRLLVGRTIAAGVELETDESYSGSRRLMAAFSDEAVARAQARALIADAGLVWLEVPEVLSLRRPPHPNRERLKQVMADAYQDWRERQAKIRRSGRRRADYLPRES